MYLTPGWGSYTIIRVSHAGGSEEAHGVQGILEAYSAAMTSVQLAGPTLFTEVLQTAMARANRPTTQADQRYDVLLILTDGIINDMQQVCAVGGWGVLQPRASGGLSFFLVVTVQ